MSTDFKIGVAIVTYNRLGELTQTIAAIHAQGILLRDIFVFDNASDQPGYPELKSNFPGLHHIRFGENRSSAGGFSEAMKEAVKNNYDWLWLFNDDSRPIRNALKTLIPFLNAPVEFSMIQIGSVDKFGYSTKLEWRGVRKPVKIPVGDQLVSSDLVTFDGCLISVDLIKAIGPCDPEFFMGTYEFEFCLRAHDAGYKVAILPNGLIEDKKLGSVGGLPPWREYYNTRNHLWLAISRSSFKIFRAWLWRELKFLIVILFIKDKKYERLVFKYRAVRDGFLGRRGMIYPPPFENDQMH